MATVCIVGDTPHNIFRRWLFCHLAVHDHTYQQWGLKSVFHDVDFLNWNIDWFSKTNWPSRESQVTTEIDKNLTRPFVVNPLRLCRFPSKSSLKLASAAAAAAATAAACARALTCTVVRSSLICTDVRSIAVHKHAFCLGLLLIIPAYTYMLLWIRNLKNLNFFKLSSSDTWRLERSNTLISMSLSISMWKTVSCNRLTEADNCSGNRNCCLLSSYAKVHPITHFEQSLSFAFFSKLR